jgi:2-dehydro-3-deoxygluconokinase
LLAEQAGPLREATTFRRCIVGAESNVAIGLARLGHRAGWLGRVGDDEFGPADLDEDDIAAASHLHLTGITPAQSPSCREAVFAAAEIARAAGVVIVLDPNVRLKLWERDEARRVLRDLASRCDVLLPGAEEAELLTGEAEPTAAARALLELGPRLALANRCGAAAMAASGDVEALPGGSM